VNFASVSPENLIPGNCLLGRGGVADTEKAINFALLFLAKAEKPALQAPEVV
jgi:hypothetical protein